MPGRSWQVRADQTKIARSIRALQIHTGLALALTLVRMQKALK